MGQVYKNAGPDAARIAGNSPEMDATAEATRAAVLAAMAPHVDTGGWARSVFVRNVPGRSGVRDRVVGTDDPHSLAREYGHWWVTPEGKVIRWIKGIRVFNNAFDAMKKG